MMNEFEEEVFQERKSGGKWFAFFLICLLGFTIGLALGFYLGVLSLVNVIGDLTDNATLIVDLDEGAVVDYAYAIIEEQYGDLATSVILGEGIEDMNLTEDEEAKLTAIAQSPQVKQVIKNIDAETLSMMEQVALHPEDRDIAQTDINWRLAE